MSLLKETIANVRGQQQGDIASMRIFINDSFPDVVKALRNVDRENTQPKRRKGFNLVKRESKKHGFIYYARYTFYHNGEKRQPKFNTHTNNHAAAEQFARDNKNRLVEGYLARQDGRMFTLLEEFFDKEQNLCISDKVKREYKNMTQSNFIPFLKREKIASFDQITRITLVNFQKKLQSGELRKQTAANKDKPVKKMTAQSVNNNMKPVKKILDVLFRDGVITENPGENIKGLKVPKSEKKERGCYDLDKIKGVFNRRWKTEEWYLLCLLIYATGMRNCEIKRLCLNDIQTINDCRFINVKKSKTDTGIRLAPLHDFVYRKLKGWTEKNKKDVDTILFNYRRAEPFNKANKELADMLEVSEEELNRENITFYSGRHFWKTLMSAEGLGEDIEEIFMGHKVVSDVKKLYNHKDKQGKARLVKKTRQMFTILDRCIFKKP